MNIRGRTKWLEFAEAAWSAAGRPEGLRPSIVETNPIEYDRSYYEYFEQRFFDNWLNLPHTTASPKRFPQPSSIGRLTKESSQRSRVMQHFAWSLISRALTVYAHFRGQPPLQSKSVL